MKIYVFADMEGASGISNGDFVTNDRPLYHLGCKYMLMDVNACVKGCFDAGANEVIVRDGHCTSVNMAWSELDPRAALIQGDAGTKRLPGIEGSDAIILLCYHAMAGTAGAVLEHTFSSKAIQNLWLNGEKAGEFAIDSAIAAEYGVPTIMASGDDKLCAEAAAWLPKGLVTCQVKEGLSTQGAKLMPAEDAHALIERKAFEAVSKIGTIKPRVLGSPVVLRKEMVERLSPGRAGRLIDARTVEITAESVEKALFALL